MQFLDSTVLLLILTLRVESLTYDPGDYMDVYPDPTDPEVLRGRTPLYFALIQSLVEGFDISGAVAGVRVALDWINNESSFLPGYTLHYTLGDSEVGLTS